EHPPLFVCVLFVPITMPPPLSPQSDPSVAMRRRILLTVGLLVLITLIGTLGFKTLSLDPATSWIDALFMTVTTMTTVGYGEIVPLGQGGRLFVIMFLMAGFAIVSYGAIEIGQWIFSAEMRHFLEKRRMDKEIHKLRDH